MPLQNPNALAVRQETTLPPAAEPLAVGEQEAVQGSLQHKGFLLGTAQPASAGNQALQEGHRGSATPYASSKTHRAPIPAWIRHLSHIRKVSFVGFFVRPFAMFLAEVLTGTIQWQTGLCLTQAVI